MKLLRLFRFYLNGTAAILRESSIDNFFFAVFPIETSNDNSSCASPPDPLLFWSDGQHVAQWERERESKVFVQLPSLSPLRISAVNRKKARRCMSLRTRTQTTYTQAKYKALCSLPGRYVLQTNMDFYEIHQAILPYKTSRYNFHHFNSSLM